MNIKANSISMNYEIKGMGPNLILIHGAGDNLNMWYHQVPVFSKSYRVITYDVRGFGKTSSPAMEYSVSLLAEDAYQLMKTIGVTEGYFLGYSMGGQIALQLAINHPEMLKALILANSFIGFGSPSPESVQRRQVAIELLDKGEMREVTEMMTTNAFSPGFKSKNPSEFDRYMKVKLQNKPEGFARVMRGLNPHPASPDISKLSCPVLLIVGKEDLYMGVEQGKQTQVAIPGSKLVVLPTGHAAAIESPDKFNQAVIEFLLEVKDR